MTIIQYRWLVDNGRDTEGLQVIADLHGGDSDDPTAMAVYQEIKDNVREDVCISYFFFVKVELFLISMSAA